MPKLTDKEIAMAKRNAALQRKCKDDGESLFGLARRGMYGKWAQAHPRAYANREEKLMQEWRAKMLQKITD